MITIREIGEHIVERHKAKIAEIEKQIDAELELRWEAGQRKIVITVGQLPREVLEHIAALYRRNNAWCVQYRSSTNNYNDLDQIEFTPGGRD